MKGFRFIRLGRRRLGLALFFTALLWSPILSGRTLAGEEVPPAILSSFESFSKSWMARLEQVSRQNSRALKPEPAADGRVIGRYICYGVDCMREVRGTDSKATPYVGIIRYPQTVMEKEGDTPQKMRAHPGVPTSEIQVTEIFRYTNGRWVY
jgi:hypothetical protein